MTEEIDVFLKEILKTPQSPNPVFNATQRCDYLGVDIVGQLAFGSSLDTQTESTNRFMPEGIISSHTYNHFLMQFPRMSSHLFAYPLHVLTAAPRKKLLSFVENVINIRVNEGIDARQDYLSHIADELPKNSDLRQSEVWSEALLILGAGLSSPFSIIILISLY